MVLDRVFLSHAGILGLISFALMIAGVWLARRAVARKEFKRPQRRVHGLLLLPSYVIALVHVGMGVAILLPLFEQFVGIEAVLHIVHIALALLFVYYFTMVIVQGYRGVMKCRDGYIVLGLQALVILLGYILRNVAFGEIIYPFL